MLTLKFLRESSVSCAPALALPEPLPELLEDSLRPLEPSAPALALPEPLKASLKPSESCAPAFALPEPMLEPLEISVNGE